MDQLRALLERYAHPCIEECEHSQCPLLRELHAIVISDTLERARLTVKPIVDREREGESVGDLMDMRLRGSSPVAPSPHDVFVDYERDPQTGEVFTVQKFVAAAPVTPEQCSATCADFSMYLCAQPHRCVLDAGHPFDPLRGDGVHEFETHQTTVRPRAATPVVEPSDDYVAWLRYVNHGQYEDSGADIITVEVCDSDAKGAFKVYARAASTPSVRAAAEEIIELLLMTEREELPRRADIEAIISRHCSPVTVAEGDEEETCKCGLPKDDPIHSYTTEWQQMHTFVAR